MTTTFSKLMGKVYEQSATPTNPQPGEEFHDTDTDCWMRYDGANWRGIDFTTTSTSSSTTSTSSSSSTTSSTSSSSSTTSTSSSTTSTSSSTTSTSSSTTSTSSSTSTTV